MSSQNMGKLMKEKNPSSGLGNTVRRFGRKVAGKIEQMGTKIGKDLFGSPELDKKQKEQGEKLNSEYSRRRGTSNGSMR